VNRQIPGGPLNDVPDFESISSMFAEAAGRHPDSIAIVEPHNDGTVKSITYRDLRSDVDSLARAMLSECESPVVGIVGRNSISWASAYLAVMRCGGVAVPIDRELPVQEMRTILHYSGANIVLFDSSYLQDFRAAVHGRPLSMIVMNGPGDADCIEFPDFLASGRRSEKLLPSSFDRHAPAAIYYTSGTMGSAKGVVLSQSNLLSVVRMEQQFVRILPNDIFLSVLPLHHTYECSCGFLAPLSAGSTYYICRGLRYVAEDILLSGATVILTVPLMWESMYRKILGGIRTQPAGRLRFRVGMVVADVASLVMGSSIRRKVFSPVHAKLGGKIRLLISGGAGIDPDVVRGFTSLGFVMLQGYGLTEAAPLLSANREKANKPSSVGPPLAEVEVRIDEPDEEGVGEIVVRGPNVMLGYHNDPEETARVLSPEGWLKTGDFGFVDREGFLYVTGRKKNVIVAKNGKNVYPEEIETKLTKSDFILESMVFGHESKLKGEEIWAIVVPDMEKLIARAEEKGGSLSTGFAVEVVSREIRHFNASQPTYKRISSFMIREDELPKTTTRKIRRREVLKEAGLEQGAVFGV